MAAVTIQRFWRGHKCRSKVVEYRIDHEIQKYWKLLEQSSHDLNDIFRDMHICQRELEVLAHRKKRLRRMMGRNRANLDYMAYR